MNMKKEDLDEKEEVLSLDLANSCMQPYYIYVAMHEIIMN